MSVETPSVATPSVDTVTADAECPECYARLGLERVMLSEIVPCTECGADLELIRMHPPQLALAPEEAEDWGE